MSTDDAPSRKPTSRPVGVPRRFAVGTLMVIVAMYSVLFAVLTSLGANPVVFGIVAVFFTGVGVGQAVFFRGTQPRDASYLAGILLCPAMLLAAFLADRVFGLSELSPGHLGIETVPQLVSAMAYLAMVGALPGYIAGCAAAGIFFVMDRIKRAREDSDAETDRPQGSATDDLTADERPSLDERLWLPVRAAIIGLSPRQKGRPVRGAVNVFIIVGTLVGLAAPFLPWPWWIHLLGTATGAFVLAFLRGVFLCRWWALLVLVILGGIGAIGPGVILRDLFMHHMVRIGDFVPFALVIVVGGLSGAMAATTLGWAQPWWERRNGTMRRRSPTGRLAVAGGLSLIILYVAVSFWLFQVSQRPEQKVLPLADRLGGHAWSTSGSLFGPIDFVDFHHTGVEDEDLRCLSHLPSLVHLDLRDTQITDAGLKHLKGLTSIQSLDLTGTQISDAGLLHLKGLKNLSYLDLSGTQITDAGLAHLKWLKNLEQIKLTPTQVTEAGVEKLKEALPDCGVWWSRPAGFDGYVPPAEGGAPPE